MYFLILISKVYAGFIFLQLYINILVKEVMRVQGELHKRYGLFTAITMVVGIVIGSGVFFKAEKVLNATGGNLPLGILAWAIGGLIMIVCAYSFSLLAGKYEKVNGIVDYADEALGSKYGYYVGWFMTMIYYPAITSVLAWVSARYTCVLFGFDIAGGEAMALAGFYLILSFGINALSPIIAGKFQVATTVIKLIPLFLMAVIGTVVGLKTGMTMENFTTVVEEVSTSQALFTAVVATAFAYEGWIVATSINSELKDSKKNLPKALILGTLIVVSAYILYYVGLAGGISNEVMMSGGETAAKMAFEKIFSSAGGTILFVFVVISCLGTLNGLMLGCTRGMYSIAARNRGPAPKVFSQIDKTTNMPNNSSVFALILCAFWLLYFYGANLTESWFGPVVFDSSELPIVTIYALYIPIFIMIIKKEKELNTFNRFVMPILSILGCIFMMVAAVFSHGIAVAWYLLVFAVIMICGCFFSKGKKE